MDPDASAITPPFLTPIALETKRLRLRQFQSADWKDIHDYYSDPEATRYTTRRVLSVSDSWQKVATAIGHWQIFGYGPFAIELKETQRVIGTTGPWYPIDWPSPEIKWALVRSFWGQGYAREAVQAIQSMVLDHLPDIAFISMIDARNQASIRLAQRVGAQLEEERNFRGGRWHLYRHPTARNAAEPNA